MDSPKTILKTFKSAKSILIPLHLRPDGDMIGCALGFYHFLKRMGGKVMVTSADPVEDNFSYLPGFRIIKHHDPAGLDLSKFDVLLLLDHGDPFRFSHEKRVELPPQLLTINIDHHDTNRAFGDLNYVNPKAASTAEVIYDLFKYWRIKITPEIAHCLLAAVYTDTGGFINTKTSHHSLTVAADLIKRGADRGKAVEKIFQSWSPRAVKVWSAILNNFKTKGHTAYSQITYEEFKKTGCTKTEISAAKGFAADKLLLVVKEVRATAIFVEENPKKIRVGLRSKGKFNVGKIASGMGGGGHINSAAFDFEGSLKEVISKTLKVMA